MDEREQSPDEAAPEEDRERAIAEENRRIRRLRFLVDLTTSTLYQDRDLTLNEARQIIRNVRGVVTRLFPGKGETFDLILLPRFERILYERWGVGMSDVYH